MNSPYSDDDRPEPAPAGGLSLGDFYYVFFRHQWKIITCFLLSVAAAAAYFFLKPPMYFSEAQILIRYILETPARASDNAQIKSLDSRADGIISAEIAIITSLNLVNRVVETVGAEKILSKVPGAADGLNPATVIRENLIVDVPKNSSLITLKFRHPDASVVQPVLTQIIAAYLERHTEIHRGAGVLQTDLYSQADQLRQRLVKTDDDLKKLKERVKVISLDEDKKAYIERLGKIRDDLMTTEAELAQHTAVLNALRAASMASTNETSAATNAVPVTAAAAPTPQQAEEYLRVSALVEAHQKALAALRERGYTDEYFGVKTALQKLADAEEQKKTLEAAHAALGRSAPAIASSGSPSNSAQIASASLHITAMDARVRALRDQLKSVGDEAARIVEVEPQIAELERLKKVDEESYRTAKSSIERARAEESSGAGKITNIKEVQTPSPAAREMGNMKKPIGLLLFVGCFGAFGLAFVWEKFLHRSIKRAIDVERAVDMPLFISVPDANWKKKGGRRRRRPEAPAPSAETPGGEAGVAAGAVVPAGDAAGAELPWDPKHALRPHFEGLRDRLITYFEVRKMTHKPKLVAVTSCRRGAGVSTMAAGLAATLSETGDGNVLLVDMNIERGAVHPFHQGAPGCALSDALEQTTREPAQIQDNLYVVSAREGNSSKLPSVLPKRFAHLIPKMKASDYDYIIFDMPPVSQTSVTARLAGFMDMMLVVIESEKTGQEVVQRASGLLNESRANLAAVLNKHRAYVPPALSQEL